MVGLQIVVKSIALNGIRKLLKSPQALQSLRKKTRQKSQKKNLLKISLLKKPLKRAEAAGVKKRANHES